MPAPKIVIVAISCFRVYLELAPPVALLGFLISKPGSVGSSNWPSPGIFRFGRAEPGGGGGTPSSIRRFRVCHHRRIQGLRRELAELHQLLEAERAQPAPGRDRLDYARGLRLVGAEIDGNAHADPAADHHSRGLAGHDPERLAEPRLGHDAGQRVARQLAAQR